MSQTHISHEKMVTLHEAELLLIRQQTLDGVLDTLYQGVSDVLDASNFYILFYDAEKRETTFALRVADGKREKPSIIQHLQEGGLTEYVLTHKRPLLLEDRVEERLTDLGIHGRQINPEHPTVSWVGVPFLLDDQVLGMMAAQSYTTPGLYGEAERDLLFMLAEQAAVVIANTREFEKMQRDNMVWKAMHKEIQALHEELEERVKALNDELAFVYGEIQKLTTRRKPVSK